MASRQKPHRGRPPRTDQCAALPFRIRGGEHEVLLVTSRETGRWVLPKGWTEPDAGAARQAAAEAYEEAGALGAIGETPLGHYSYAKRLPGGAIRTCQVQVFPLNVERLLEDWPEKHQRERRWFSPEEAATLVAEAELGALMRRFGEA